MRKTATSRDLFAKLEDELRKKPIKGSKPAASAKASGKGGEDGYTAADIEVLKGSSRCAGVPACISAAPTRRRCITSSPRCSTTP